SPEDGDARADLVALYARKLAPRLAGSAQDQALAAESARQFDRFAGVSAGATLNQALRWLADPEKR
ncbi:MAG: hypothetical protein HY926_15565, partial [Elusimicrobia bacterium]|nr:hypothetical protein [Elusimicrobiota bacterium]